VQEERDRSRKEEGGGQEEVRGREGDKTRGREGEWERGRAAFGGGGGKGGESSFCCGRECLFSRAMFCGVTVFEAVASNCMSRDLCVCVCNSLSILLCTFAFLLTSDISHQIYDISHQIYHIGSVLGMSYPI